MMRSMKPGILFSLITFLLLACGQTNVSQETQSADPVVDEKKQEMQSVYQFTVKDIYGNDFSFSTLKGKKIMIVNTASKCGFTPQYEDLQRLYEEEKDNNFVIVGFPANNFLNQAPGTNEEIISFCKNNYGVSFPMMSKISVKGDDMHPLYQFLTRKTLNGVLDSEVKWNFQKYLLDEEGRLVQMISPRMKPFDPEIIGWINKS